MGKKRKKKKRKKKSGLLLAMLLRCKAGIMKSKKDKAEEEKNKDFTDEDY